jgi:putative transposase
MKRSRFSDEKIIGIVKEQKAGAVTADVCRRHDISEATAYKWKAKFGGLEVTEAKRLRALEEENAKLKKLLAEAMLNIEVLKDISSKKMVTPGAKRDAVAHARNCYGLSKRRACQLIGIARRVARRTCPYQTGHLDCLTNLLAMNSLGERMPPAQLP